LSCVFFYSLVFFNYVSPYPFCGRLLVECQLAQDLRKLVELGIGEPVTLPKARHR